MLMEWILAVLIGLGIAVVLWAVFASIYWLGRKSVEWEQAAFRKPKP